MVATLEYFYSVNTPDDDVSTAGGAIQNDAHASGGKIPDILPMAAADTVEQVSTAADARNGTIVGRLVGGGLATETLALNGTTPVAFANTYETILSYTVDAKAATTATLRRAAAGGDIAILGANKTAALSGFRKSISGGTQLDRFEYIYAENTHATDDINAATGEISLDPGQDANHDLQISVRGTKGDMATVVDRLTAPPSSAGEFVTFVDQGTTQAILGDTLLNGERVAIAVRQRLAISATAQRNTYQLKVAGTDAS